ncbi:MAG: hypothetical protein WA634_14955 [Silvibacterium sp.]
MRGNNSKKESNGKEFSGPVPFESVLQIDVPKGRDGKHKQIILRLLNDLDRLRQGMALKIPLSQLPDTKENIRSALSRAARQKDIAIATSSNDDFLYVWMTDEAEAEAV